MKKSINPGKMIKMLDLPRKISRYCKDIRQQPEIPLSNIIIQMFISPLLGERSLLSIDRNSRSNTQKKLFGVTGRKMVASDSTMSRVLRWLKSEEITDLCNSLKGFLKSDSSFFRIKIKPGSRNRRIGIIDGSCMGGHYVCAFALAGKITIPIMFRTYKNRGHELNTAHDLVEQIYRGDKEQIPDLYLLDALYFTTNIFTCIRENENHLLIKCKNSEFREVLRDARIQLNADGDEEMVQGYDGERMCGYEIELTRGEFAGYPVRVAHIKESYSKRPEANREEDFWVVTTDLSLDREEIREAAHMRWEIENNVFKSLNEHCGTKNKHIATQRAFLNRLWIVSTGLFLFKAILRMFKENNEKQYEKTRNGIKPTYRNMFFAITQRYFTDGIFAA